MSCAKYRTRCLRGAFEVSCFIHRTMNYLDTFVFLGPTQENPFLPSMSRDVNALVFLGHPIKLLAYSEYLDMLQLVEQNGLPRLNSLIRKPSVAEWTAEDITELESAAEAQLVTVLYLKDFFPTTKTWLDYLASTEASLEECMECYRWCKYDFNNGNACFNAVVAKLKQQNENADVLSSLYLDMLAIPHKNLESTYQDFSQHVSNHRQDQYVDLMKKASKLKSQADKNSRHFLRHETQIAENPNNPVLWRDYIILVSRYRHRTHGFHETLCLFYRSLFEAGAYRVGDPAWFPIWETVLDLAAKDPACPREELQLLRLQCVRSYPLLCKSYVLYLRTLGVSEDLWLSLKREISALNLLDAPYSSWLRLAEQVLFHISCLDAADISDALEFGYKEIEAGDVSYGIADFVIGVCRKKGSLDAAVAMANELASKFPQNAVVWAKCFRVLLAETGSYGQMLESLQENIHSMDSPFIALNVMLQELRLLEDKEEFENATNLYEILLDAVATRPRPLPEHIKVDSEPPEKKRQKADKTEVSEKEDPKRSREQFRVRLLNIGSSTSEQEVRVFLDGYANPLSVCISPRGEGAALVELASEKEVLSCLVRDAKVLKDRTVSVSRVFGNTVWVTNYPASYGPSKVREVFTGLCSEAVSIRLPSQQNKKERRFLYLDFLDHESANAAQQKLDGLDIEDTKLHAEISNPTLKRPRAGPDLSKQVYVHNLDFKKTDRELLQEALQQFGEVESVNVPLNEKNQSLGHKNNGYAFVTFRDKESAQQALHQETVVDGRSIKVSKAKTKEALTTPTTSEFSPLNTISLSNVNTCITSEFLKQFLESQVGSVTRIQLKPSKGSALVEFENVHDAGKAAMKLEGILLEEMTLKVGSKSDFFKDPDATGGPAKRPTMAPPMLMRRRRR